MSSRQWLMKSERGYILGVGVLATILAVMATLWAYQHQVIVAYGDAESHLNIAKRVVDSITPGLAQLGGIWLPLPHLLLVPLVKNDWLWRTGLAGSIVSGIGFVVSSVYLYKIGKLVSGNNWVGVIAAVVFMTNPNILYFQTTPMTEIPLLTFFILSSYYFIRFALNSNSIPNLLLAAFFGLAASVTRYDGWFLVAGEAVLVLWVSFRDQSRWSEKEGKVILYSSMAFLGIALWLIWDWLILGNPLYFSASQYSAASQQNSWLTKGELPSYHNLGSSLLYYGVTSITNIGIIISAAAVIGGILYVLKRPKAGISVMGLLLIPFVFYVATLYIGQSVIFIPSLTPKSFEFHLFNVRYGLMMVPMAAVLVGFLWWRLPKYFKIIPLILIALQITSFTLAKESVITYADGTVGLSRSKSNNAQTFIATHYTGGKVLIDDYARTISIVKSPIPMQEIIYVGNKPYWERSLVTPERYATWIVIQKNDTLWKNIYQNPAVRDRLYTYFEKAYTSNEILVFKRNEKVPAPTY